VKVRLRHVAVINPPTPEFELLPDTAELPFLPLEAVWPGDRLDTTRRQPKAAVSTGYTRFREGDILVPKITPTFQADRTVIAKGLEGGVGAGTTELHVVRAGLEADVRYLRYLLSSKEFLDEGEASMIGVAGQKRVPDDCLRNLAVPIVDLRRQHAIAGYLDREIARIDALIEKKQRMIELLEEHEQRSMLETVGDWRTVPTVSLRQLSTSVVTGPFGTQLSAGEYTIGQIPVINPVHIQRGRIESEENVTVTEATAARLDRHRLRQGDLVLGRKGDVGRAAVVETSQDGWLCGSDSIAVRVDPDRVSGELLAGILRIDYYRQQLGALSTGAMVASIHESSLLSFRLPALPLSAQNDLALRLQRLRRHCDELVGSLERQLALLAEHRQALITAAVTGGLKIRGVAA